jgi:transposase
MARPRTTYTAEYKLAAVKMITEQKLSVAETARRLDVSETLLRAWRKAVLARGEDAFPGHGNPYVLVDKRDRKPVRPLAFHAHDGRELSAGEMEQGAG